MTIVLYPYAKGDSAITIKNVQQIETINGVYVIRTYTVGKAHASFRYEVSKYALTVWSK